MMTLRHGDRVSYRRGDEIRTAAIAAIDGSEIVLDNGDRINMDDVLAPF